MPYELSEPVPKPKRSHTPDPVGVVEIAERLGVKDRSVHMWKRRDRLPPLDYPSVNGTGAWEWRTILWWAGETGRLYTGSSAEAFTDEFGATPNGVKRKAPA